MPGQGIESIRNINKKSGLKTRRKIKMNFEQEIEKRYIRIDELVIELSDLITSYNKESVYSEEPKQMSDKEKAEKMVALTQEIYVMEIELEILNEVVEESEAL